ncbi:hypothetical protein [Herbidospora sp. NBRC 101105]|uniref:hypothetical protein n=1 Tax=Herbidospora sp. NBRC 101105 TaxID=3032195 RepID=UPI0025571563|nr:hypothetical protein [Herbidospora sp. NBRC 101105]
MTASTTAVPVPADPFMQPLQQVGAFLEGERPLRDVVLDDLPRRGGQWREMEVQRRLGHVLVPGGLIHPAIPGGGPFQVGRPSRILTGTRARAGIGIGGWVFPVGRFGSVRFGGVHRSWMIWSRPA